MPWRSVSKWTSLRLSPAQPRWRGPQRPPRGRRRHQSVERLRWMSAPVARSCGRSAVLPVWPGLLQRAAGTGRCGPWPERGCRRPRDRPPPTTRCPVAAPRPRWWWRARAPGARLPSWGRLGGTVPGTPRLPVAEAGSSNPRHWGWKVPRSRPTGMMPTDAIDQVPHRPTRLSPASAPRQTACAKPDSSDARSNVKDGHVHQNHDPTHGKRHHQ